MTCCRWLAGALILAACIAGCSVDTEAPASVSGFGGSAGQAGGGHDAGPAGAAGQILADGSTQAEADAGCVGEGCEAPPTGLAWPIECTLGVDCQVTYPDIDGDGKAFDCGLPGYEGHQGTDISIGWSKMDEGTDVYAAADGEVLWVFDGKYDRCPDAKEPDCQKPGEPMGPDVDAGFMVCTSASDAYCLGTKYTTGCYFCFWGGNVVVLRHPGHPEVFATRYDHLRKGSIVVTAGQKVSRGQKLAQVGSAGNSTGPHLHFEVWSGGFYVLADPWAGPCGPNKDHSLWEKQP
jgi:hypothetical protein